MRREPERHPQFPLRFKRVVLQTLLRLALLCQVSCISTVTPMTPWLEPIDLEIEGGALRDVVIDLSCGRGGDLDTKYIPSSLRACRDLVEIFEADGATVVGSGLKAKKRAKKRAKKTEQVISKNGRKKNPSLKKHTKAKTSKQPDFSVVFVERYEGGASKPGAASSFRRSLAESRGKPLAVAEGRIKYGSSLWLCLITLTYLPCYDEVEAWAEILIYDRNETLRKRIPLTAKVTDYMGLGVLASMLLKKFGADGSRGLREEIARRLSTYIVSEVVTFNVQQKLVERQESVLQ